MTEKFTDLCLAQGMYDDLARRYTELLNDLWGLLYPDKPTAWDYPAQVIREVMTDFHEMEAYIKSSGETEMNDELRARLGIERLGEALRILTPFENES